MAEHETTIVLRIDKDLKKAFENVAKEKDRTISQMIRGYIRYEVETNTKAAQKDLFKPEKAPEKKGQAKPSPKAKNPPMDSRDALLGMFKKR